MDVGYEIILESWLSYKFWWTFNCCVVIFFLLTFMCWWDLIINLDFGGLNSFSSLLKNWNNTLHTYHRIICLLPICKKVRILMNILRERFMTFSLTLWFWKNMQTILQVRCFIFFNYFVSYFFFQLDDSFRF
jgi:hypothetical protein